MTLPVFLRNLVTFSQRFGPFSSSHWGTRTRQSANDGVSGSDLSTVKNGLLIYFINPLHAQGLNILNRCSLFAVLWQWQTHNPPLPNHKRRSTTLELVQGGRSSLYWKLIAMCSPTCRKGLSSGLRRKQGLQINPKRPNTGS